MTADGNNHLSGLTYDPSSNTLTDGANTYTWDAESQMKTAAGVTYAYDGDGRRVSKSNGKLYWYGSGSEILAETDAAGNTTNEYIFFGGQRIAILAAGSTPLYYAEDFLGSSRVMVTSTGVVCYDADFTPFGGERAYTNTCPSNYKFEGKERDTETGNDDFGARYYSNRLGRWLSSDWSAVPVPVPYANLTNPQTLNLYSMASDDPESFADLDGHAQYSPANSPCGYEQQAQCQRAAELVQSALNNPDFRHSLPPCICDDYNLDKYGHGAPHIDRVDKNGKLVGRYDENGNPLKHGKKGVPPKIPNSDKGRFGKAADKLREYKERLAKANAPKEEGQQQTDPQQQKSPASLRGPLYDLCAGGPCDGFTPFFPLPGGPLPTFNFNFSLPPVPVPEFFPI